MDPHKVKAFAQLSAPERWKLIEEFADNAGLNKTINMVTELFDKTNYGYETIGGSILID